MYSTICAKYSRKTFFSSFVVDKWSFISFYHTTKLFCFNFIQGYHIAYVHVQSLREITFSFFFQDCCWPIRTCMLLIVSLFIVCTVIFASQGFRIRSQRGADRKISWLAKVVYCIVVERYSILFPFYWRLFRFLNNWQ